ncbi:alpha-amylase family glycosyl hydrolase [Anaeromicropila populeti]|uniref:Glycogen operon protein n=1 Tax=Anaeromicropila populeti TaxID=37658 RepID=A0A1I6JDS8_9FIRM|nr:alpha-amylase family glycosyl hydrolase [Anaeromicropila populeti]SFR77077.1 glycogen operon protein [Anaeromicropila populeti]
MKVGRKDFDRAEKGTGLPLGAYVRQDSYVQFSVSIPDHDNCILHLYRKGGEKPVQSFTMDKTWKRGTIFSIVIKLPNIEEYEYLYEVGNRYYLDPYTKLLTGRSEWGKVIPMDEVFQVRSKIVSSKNQIWMNDFLQIPFEELIIYKLHIRGFTKDPSSRVKQNGTFCGVVEKIPYLKELGINAVELMPCYDFDEIIQTTQCNVFGISSSISRSLPREYVNENDGSMKINYWGYTDKACYFAPKASYCAEPLYACDEFMEMILKLHANGIEVYMDMHFAADVNQCLIVDCLHYWVYQYGIDGFVLNQEAIPQKLLATDPVLGNIKLFTGSWDAADIYKEYKEPAFRNLCEYNDGFMIDARKYLKGDEEQVARFSDRIKRNPGMFGVVNYISNTNSFTLMDMVSYDVKHNDKNGENGRDGTEYNHSWNCGVEGKTRKKSVLELRRRQIKNALLMLFFSQGTPLIMAGDEFGNSQDGNNNPYCQDNEISWLNWSGIKTSSWILEYVKMLIRIRKEHRILHMPSELRMMDYISCGCPDISFHGTRAWYLDCSNYSRELGVLLCGQYAKIDRKHCDSDFYIAFNMHWEAHLFNLPKPLKQLTWKVLMDTSEPEEKQDEEIEITEKSYEVKARTIVVFSCHE